MRQFLKIAIIILFSIGIALIMHSCKKPVVPVVTTASVSGINQTSATSGGNVTDDGGAEVTARGICWSTTQNPTTASTKTSDGTGTGVFTSSITGLTPGTNYFVKAYATNSVGTSYGNEVPFSSNPVLLATLTTTVANSVTSTTAISGGNISSDGGGPITARGVCWSISQNPTTADSKTNDGNGTGSFTSNLTGLSLNTTYYIKAFATNSAGTAYGNQLSFKTGGGIGAIIFNPNLTYGTVSDIENNIYKTIQIGTQTWMAENLKTTKLNDNSPIPNVTDFNAWNSLSSQGYCWYQNDASTYKAIYGALYNWFAVGTGKLCPAGWHVPSDNEWISLRTYLGGVDIAGGKLKETGTTHWQSPNEGATNESGFTALPGAYRDISNDFGNGQWIGSFGKWWSTTNEDPVHYYELHLNYSDSKFWFSGGYYGYGLSVRCLKD